MVRGQNGQGPEWSGARMVRGQDGPTPDKQTYYNLGNITKKQLVERLNTAVAMSF